METLLSTCNVHNRDGFDYWHAMICRKLVHHDAQPIEPLTFVGNIHAGAINTLDMFVFEHSPLRIAGDRNHVRQLADDGLLLIQPLEGTLKLQQDGGDVVIAPRDICLLDPLRPYVGHFPSFSKVLVIKLPRKALRARLGAVPGIEALCVRPETAIAQLTSNYLTSLPQLIGGLKDIDRLTVSTQILDLVALTFSAVTGVDMSSRRSFALLRVHAAVDALFLDPAVTADTIAAKAGVSVRYANALLAKQGTSVSRLVLSKRLESCRRTLEDPKHKGRSISEIAFDWGFSSMTHFGRAFKRAYGEPPREYRQRKTIAAD